MKIDPVVFDYEDERIDKLKSGQITEQQFIASIRPQDSFFFQDGMLTVVTEENQARRLKQFVEVRKQMLVANGGLLPAVVLDNKVKFLQVYPELQNIYSEVEQQMQAANCKGCQKRQYGEKVIAALLALPYNNRDLTSLNEIVSETALKKLRGETIDPNTIEIPIPPFMQKTSFLKKHDKTADISKLTENPGQVVREPCMDCVKKHLAQATILLSEVMQGYAGDSHLHKWLAIGHLAEAADEALAVDPELAAKIRAIRVEIMGQKKNV